MERTAAVAGQFYPADPRALEAALENCMEGADRGRDEPLAVVVPHAGYIYSGRTAGRVYAGLRLPRRIVLLGPNHSGRGRAAALRRHGAWRTPLGAVAVDEALADAVLAASPTLEDDAEAHRLEHSLEVQLPFLQKLGDAVRIVPICLADLGLPALLDLGEALAAILSSQEDRPLIIISSDMSHYLSRQEARRRDELALARLVEVDAAGLHAVVRRHNISMCGVVPAVVGLAAARALGARRGVLVDYSCSADVTGDDASVVAYAGMTLA